MEAYRMNEILTPIEAGEYLNVHVRTIYRLGKSGSMGKDPSPQPPLTERQYFRGILGI
jgi:hypothetical protein